MNFQNNLIDFWANRALTSEPDNEFRSAFQMFAGLVYPSFFWSRRAKSRIDGSTFSSVGIIAGSPSAVILSVLIAVTLRLEVNILVTK
jgi:hypothetical protein